MKYYLNINDDELAEQLQRIDDDKISQTLRELVERESPDEHDEENLSDEEQRRELQRFLRGERRTDPRLGR